MKTTCIAGEMTVFKNEALLKKCLEDPNRRNFINWRIDGIEIGMTMLLCLINFERLDISELLVEHMARICQHCRRRWMSSVD